MSIWNIIALWASALWVIAATVQQVVIERSEPGAKRTAGLWSGISGAGITYAIVYAAVYLGMHS